MSRQVDFDIFAKDLIHLTREEVWRWRDPSVRGYIRFEDGVLYTRGSIAITCYYIWQIARDYPSDFKFYREYVQPVIDGFRTTTPGDVAAIMVNDAEDAYGLEDWFDRESEDRRVYEMVNSIYNMIDLELDEYTLSLNAFDYLEVFTHPDVEHWKHKIDNEVNLTSASIADYSDKIIDEVLTNKDFDNNSLATYARGNLIKLGQLANSIAAIGYTTEIDSSIFPNPIRKCYFEGMSELWELMQESRSASLASMYQQIVMPDSEYFNRTLQLVCGTLQNLHKGEDCGSKEYLYTTVKDKTMLKAMFGIWAVDEDTGNLFEIKKQHTNLIGKTIRHRSPLTCHHHDRNGICGKCFGTLERAVPAGTNIGHTSAVEFCGPLSQLVLSLKHYISNASASLVKLSATDLQFVKVDESDGMLYLNKNLKRDEWEVVLLAEDVPNIHDVDWVEDISVLNPARIGRIRGVNFRKVDNHDYNYTLYIGTESHPAAFTSEFLRFAKDQHWRYDFAGNYVFSLKDFNEEWPLLEVPQIKFSPPEFIGGCKKFLLMKDANGKQVQHKSKYIADYDSLDVAVSSFYDLIDGYLNTHYSHLQVIVLSLCAESAEKRDYRLPINRHEGRPAPLTDLLRYRSLSATMAYERQKQYLMMPSSYTIRNRPPHPYDPILTGV